MNALLRTLTESAPRLGLAGAALAFLAAPAAGQVLIDDFDNGIGPGEFVFAGAEAGTLTAVDVGGGDLVAQFLVDGDEYGGFTGFGQPIEGGSVDISGLMRPVLEFDLIAAGSFTLEINFQNTGGGGEGEIRNALQFQLGPSNEDPDFRTYRIPLETFFTTNASTFEENDVFQYVFTVINATGDGDGAVQETGFQVDNVRVVEGLALSTTTEVVSFDSGDFSEFFFFGGGEGIAASATTDTPDGSPNAFSGALDGDEYNGFAGFGRTIVGAPIDASGAETVNFFYRANGPARMEFNLQTNAASGGNEGRENIALENTNMEWVPMSIPLRALLQTGAAPPDFSQVYNFVATIVDLPGDGDPSTTEFTFELDQIGFGSSAPVAARELPESFSAAPVAFPNPTAGTSTVAFELATAQDVSVEMYDLLGRRVATLAEGPQAAGAVRVPVSTGTLAPGVYVVRVRTAAGVAATRLTVLR